MIETPFRIHGRLLGVLVVLAAFIPVRARALEDYTAPRNAQVDAQGARAVEIEASAGSLRVEGVPGLTHVRVRGTARASTRGRLDDIKLIAERRGNVVFIKAVIPENNGRGFWDALSGDRFRMQLDLVIDVPLSLALNVSDGSGEAEFNNVGALSLTDGSGEVHIRGARGNVEINDGSGKVDIDGVEGSVRIHDGSGEIRARNVTGDFTVEDDGSGNIDVSGVGGTMRVQNDGSGSIDVDRIAGDFVVDEGGGGSIRYDTVKGKVSVPDRRRRGSR